MTKCQINYNKIQTNCHLFNPNSTTNCIAYAGRIFHMDSLEVSGNYRLEQNGQLRRRFKIWNQCDHYVNLKQ